MGLFDVFRMGEVFFKTSQSIKKQRNPGRNLAALPMAELVPEALRNLNRSGAWQGRARPAVD